MRLLITTVPILAAVVAAAVLHDSGSAEACAGLIGSNGAVNLGRTTTLAAYHDGVEHYVTAFQFAGGGGQFGSIVPLPGIPTKVERGGDWTLQRLIRETDPPKPILLFAAAGASRDSAQVILQVRIDALDITILKGGGDEVGAWAKDHGFRLPPDAPEVLDFYANRSPIFLAAVFDADAARARRQSIGDGTPVHITIPTANPWVPLRILALGKTGGEKVEADVYLLNDRQPALLPDPNANGLKLQVSHPAHAAGRRLMSSVSRRAAAALLAALLLGVVVSGCGGASPMRIQITIHYSRYDPSRLTVPHGVPVTFVIINSDPIDHEWIVGDAALHQRHRTGTEPVHNARPTEITIPALPTRETTVTLH